MDSYARKFAITNLRRLMKVRWSSVHEFLIASTNVLFCFVFFKSNLGSFTDTTSPPRTIIKLICKHPKILRFISTGTRKTHHVLP